MRNNPFNLIVGELKSETMVTPGVKRNRVVEQNKRDFLRIIIRAINRSTDPVSNSIVSLPLAKKQANAVLAEILREYPRLLQPEILLAAMETDK